MPQLLVEFLIYVGRGSWRWAGVVIAGRGFFAGAGVVWGLCGCGHLAGGFDVAVGGGAVDLAQLLAPVRASSPRRLGSAESRPRPNARANPNERRTLPSLPRDESRTLEAETADQAARLTGLCRERSENLAIAEGCTAGSRRSRRETGAMWRSDSDIEPPRTRVASRSQLLQDVSFVIAGSS